MNPKQQARLGLFYLEESILDILSDGEARPEIISKRVGIRSLTDERHTTSYSIVTGILVKLKQEGRVERCDDARWKLTEREREERTQNP